jgi:hypothetical protein
MGAEDGLALQNDPREGRDTSIDPKPGDTGAIRQLPSSNGELSSRELSAGQ